MTTNRNILRRTKINWSFVFSININPSPLFFALMGFIIGTFISKDWPLQISFILAGVLFVAIIIEYIFLSIRKYRSELNRINYNKQQDLKLFKGN